jgi:hypothetical protein
MKTKFLKPDERLARLRRCRNRNALNLCRGPRGQVFVRGVVDRRPDAQPFAFGPQPIGQGNMKAVQFHAGVKAALQFLHDAGAQEGLCPVQQSGHNPGQSRNHRQQTARNPLEPPVSAPKRCPNASQSRLPIGIHCRRIRLPHFLNRR